MQRRSTINITLVIFLALLLLHGIRSGEFSDPKHWFIKTLMLLPGIIIGIAFHEYAHALSASKLGDPTPKFQGRVTLNPIAHIEPFGFIALIFCGFGWGKPVMINPNNFRKRRRDELIVGLSGVVMNLVLAVVFTALLKFLLLTMGSAFSIGSPSAGLRYYLQLMVIYAVQINLVLMIFNLIPVPPLDGFGVIIEIFNLKNTQFYRVVYEYGQWILLILLLFGIVGRILQPAVSICMNLLFNIFGIPVYI